MGTLVKAISVSLLLAILAFAQAAQNPATQPAASTSAQQSPGQAGQTPRIAPGTVIPVQLTKGVEAKKAKTGDGVEAKVTQDLKAGNGQVVVPKDTKVIGHVTEAQAGNKDQKGSQLGIAFDHAVLKNGEDLKLPMAVQAIISPATLNPAADEPAAENTPTQAQPRTPGGMAAPAGQSPGPGAGTASSSPSNDSATPSHPPITAQTQGVVGMSNLKLANTTDGNLGSVVSSEKNNVKLESGTLMLLRVSQ
jgi:hypothetical protein